MLPTAAATSPLLLQHPPGPSSGVLLSIPTYASGRCLKTRVGASTTNGAGRRWCFVDLWTAKTPSGRGSPAARAAGGVGAFEEDAAAAAGGVVNDRIGRSRSLPLDILHVSDGLFAAVYKPPLMHVHRPEFGSKDKEFVMQKARDQLGRRVYLPHRLDRGTSGCLLLGFSPEAVKVLHEALAHPSSTKTYVTVVRGSGEAHVGKGWFTVSRPVKDDKKVLREASTRFLFVRGGVAPDPRCCLVLAQPSTGRFHQIRRHLNGLGHPVVGDSAHGSSRFNREVAGHAGNPAPSGRLLLHCLRLELPTLPGTCSDAWKAGTGAAAAAAAGKTQPRSEKGRHAGGGGTRPGGGGTGEAEEDDGSDGTESDVVWEDGGFTAGEPETEVSSSDPDPLSPTRHPNERRVVAAGTRRDRSASSPSISGSSEADRGSGGSGDADSRRNEGTVGGLEVHAEPPEDMMAFLRGMTWWEEGMIQEAECSGRQVASQPP